MKSRVSAAIRAAGRKPSVAHRNEAKALENIEAKIRAMESLASSANAMENGITLPRSLRMFNRWVMTDVDAKSSNLLSGFHGNSQDTLRRSPALRARVELALKASLDMLQRAADYRVGSESKIRKKFRNAIEKVTVLEREIIELRRSLSRAREENQQISHELKCLKENFAQSLKVSKAVLSPKKPPGVNKIVPLHGRRK